MKRFNWNLDKNQQLQEKRGIGFDDIVKCVREGNLLDVIQHYNLEKYPIKKF